MQFKIMSLLAIVTVVAIQLAICRLPSGWTSGALSTIVFLVVLCYGIANLLYSSELAAKGFSLGLLLPATVFLFGNTWLVKGMIPTLAQDDPFGASTVYNQPEVFALLSIAGVICGAVINIFGAVISKDVNKKHTTRN